MAVRYVRIDLGSIDGSVAEELLDGAYVGAVVEEVRGEDVSEDMRRDLFRDAGLSGAGLDEALDGTRREARRDCFPARNIYEKRFRHVLAGL